ncbi:hypothetical protein L6452_08676 [Arctium lappa]|uniref:Uncharacterized protein n=1 Tax=Arctium lappa TaxID=4217 RepID=A0ACB9DI87_ARCLA|nr:hypothetical protein L6452_08676 [Arctium lappa]
MMVINEKEGRKKKRITIGVQNRGKEVVSVCWPLVNEEGPRACVAAIAQSPKTSANVACTSSLRGVSSYLHRSSTP